MDASKSALPFQGDAPLPFQDHHRVLGVGARQVTADINHFLPKERLEQAAMQDERLRLARELHDGVLQTLTGALLQLEALSRLMEADPEGCPQTVAWPRGTDRGGATRATRLDPAEFEAARGSSDGFQHRSGCGTRQAVQAGRLAVGLRLELTMGDSGMITRTLGDHVYRLALEMSVTSQPA